MSSRPSFRMAQHQGFGAHGRAHLCIVTYFSRALLIPAPWAFVNSVRQKRSGLFKTYMLADFPLQIQNVPHPLSITRKQPSGQPAELHNGTLVSASARLEYLPRDSFVPRLILVAQLALAMCWVAGRASVADGTALPGYDTGVVGGGTLAGGDPLEGVATDQLGYDSVAHPVRWCEKNSGKQGKGKGCGDDGNGVVEGCFRVTCLVSLVRSVAPRALSAGFYGTSSFPPGGYLAAVFMPPSLVHGNV